jgi:hypothetical protein
MATVKIITPNQDPNVKANQSNGKWTLTGKCCHCDKPSTHVVRSGIPMADLSGEVCDDHISTEAARR